MKKIALVCLETINSGGDGILADTTRYLLSREGVQVVTVKKGHRVAEVQDYAEGRFVKPSRYRAKTLPAAGAVLSAEDQGEQMTL